MKVKEINDLLAYPFVIYSDGTMVIFCKNKKATEEILEIRDTRRVTISVVFDYPLIYDFDNPHMDEIYFKNLERRLDYINMCGITLDKISLCIY